MKSDPVYRMQAGRTEPVRRTAAVFAGKLVELRAAGKSKVPRFTMLAYTGKAFSPNLDPPLEHPVVVDLMGLDMTKQQVPALKDHDQRDPVGHVESVGNDGRRLTATGLISGAGESARQVIDASRNGYRWQVSISADLRSLYLVKAGSTVNVNGRVIPGPVYVARTSRLREISFLSLGADDDTAATIAAAAAKGTVMSFAEWLRKNGFDPETISTQQRVTLYASYAGQTTRAQASKKPQTFEKWLEGGELDLNAEGDDALSEEQVTSLRAAYALTQPAKKKKAAPAPVVARAGRKAAPTVDDPDDGDDGDDQAPDAATMVQELHTEMQAMRRESRIRTLCGEAHAEIADAAIEAGWTDEHVKSAIEAAELRASLPQSLMIKTRRASDAPSPSVVMEAAICQAGGMANVEKAFTAPALEEANRMYRGRVGLQEVILEAAIANGYQGRAMSAIREDLRGVLMAASGQGVVMRAGFSSFSLPGILSNSANKFLLMGFMSVEDTWREISAVRSVSDFKAITSYRLTGSMEYEEVGPNGELKHGELGEASFTNRAKTFGKLFAITRTDIINDDMGALTAVPQRLGRGAKLKFNKVFWAAFMDNASFFSSDNANYFEGAGTVLGIDSLTTAEQKFLDQTDPDGDPVSIAPEILLTPNALSTKATSLTRDTEIRDTTANTKSTTGNPHAGKFRPVRSSYLSNTGITGYSSTAWYLLGNPSNGVATIETVFLNGRQEPFIESADTDFNTLGVQMRGYHDFGVTKQEHRGGVKAKGAA